MHPYVVGCQSQYAGLVQLLVRSLHHRHHRRQLSDVVVKLVSPVLLRPVARTTGQAAGEKREGGQEVQGESDAYKAIPIDYKYWAYHPS